MKTLITSILIFLSTFCSGQNKVVGEFAEAPVNGGFQMKNYWVWGSSVIKGDDGNYHMYASRWPKYLPFHPGWMIGSEIVHAVSHTPEGPYTFVDVALGARGSQFWDGRSCHNPKIVRYKGEYILYYMGSTHPFEDITEQNADELTLDSKWCIAARWRKRIGIATSKSPNGPWKRSDQPILDVKPNSFYSFLTSNPSPLIKKDGSVVLIFKSRDYNEDGITKGDMSVSVATAPSYDGKYTVLGDQALFSKDNFGEIEDPHLWSDNEGYHMIAKDQRGQITGVAGDGLLAHSKDGINWFVDKNPKAYTKIVKWDNGKTIKQGQLERPFVLVEDGKPTHLFFATMNGSGGFGNGTRTWNMVIPLK
ncbi:glycoside hydrolase family protein [Ancylomarina sp. 16SWW S1-10-2]|uniref:glycoside hydrolase family protein n=1 Tax=Ancylomarina sp. 16SWW S1-10-2 TaxID=2499681 RepID=UPI0012AE85C1|nr:glycoside hydrolase family protein [Ancylomarina sp. 16SWW S1-10-2]MRT93800.1 glycosyl hydrolase family 43 [Ancylomarina sp. 16SWW S1-10-2]